MRVGIAVYASARDDEADTYKGTVWGKYRRQEVWSKGTNTLSDCTAAIADLHIDGLYYRTGETSIRC